MGQNATIALRLLSSHAFFHDPVGYAAHHPGRLVQLASPTGRAALLLEPEEIWRVLVTDATSFRQGRWKRRARRFLGATLNTLDGPEHRERRLLLQPALDRRRIATWADAIATRADALQETWEDGVRLGLRATFDPLSLAMAGDVLLGTDLGPVAPELAGALARVMSRLPRLTPPFPGTAQARALSEVHRQVRVIVAGRRDAAHTGDDLLSILLRAGLPEPLVVGELTAFMLAAVDEPPSGLAAAWYLLGRSPEAEARFHGELDSVLAGNRYAAAHEARLPFLAAVQNEALRLYPPARHVDRCPVADTVVAGTSVRAGTNVLISPLVMHHEPSFYPRPEAFAPERWLEGNGEGIVPRGAYIPFGAGPHTCIGEPLARLIMTATLATVGSRWRLRVDAGAHPPVPGRPDLVVALERR